MAEASPKRANTTRPRRGPGRPRNETPSPEYVQRRKEIVEGAITVFQAKGYDAGSLDDVASALDLRKASLYHYVRSKAELLHLVFDRAISVALQDLDQIAISNSPSKRLELLLRHQVRTVASDPGLFAVFFDQRPHLAEAYEAEIYEKERRYLRVFIDAVSVAADNNLLDVKDPRYAAQLLLGMANWISKWFDPDHDDAEALADDAVRLILGSTPRPAR